ncbi:MAG: shikimate dehydrogenase [Clostridia bacterium]|nr:shikimate dehydrogenase [Clostridia bacterium]
MKPLKMAVIGKDVSKSLSPKMHHFILKNIGVECTYDTVSIPQEEFKTTFPKLLTEYDTLNVTIPYKLDVIPYLSEIKGDAKTFGAVNTVDVRTKNGYNTDGAGFMLLLENGGVSVKGKNILVLGSGGVGRSVIKKLLDGGAIVSAFDLNQAGLNEVHAEFPFFTALKAIEIKPYDVIINCTGVGMHKTEGISPVGEDLLSQCNTAVDLIYEPKKSEFLRLAESLGKKIVNGESMIFYQAYYADCIFLGREPVAAQAKELFEKYREE